MKSVSLRAVGLALALAVGAGCPARSGDPCGDDYGACGGALHCKWSKSQCDGTGDVCNGVCVPSCEQARCPSGCNCSAGFGSGPLCAPGGGGATAEDCAQPGP